MNFRDARDLAAEYGARMPKFDHTSPVAECWIDRVEWLASCKPEQLADAIEECNRYAG